MHVCVLAFGFRDFNDDPKVWYFRLVSRVSHQVLAIDGAIDLPNLSNPVLSLVGEPIHFSPIHLFEFAMAFSAAGVQIVCQIL